MKTIRGQLKVHIEPGLEPYYCVITDTSLLYTPFNHIHRIKEGSLVKISNLSFLFPFGLNFKDTSDRIKLILKDNYHLWKESIGKEVTIKEK